MNTNYRIISFLFTLLTAITTTNTSYYRDKAYEIGNRAYRNYPITTGIGVGVGVGVGVLAVGYMARGRMRRALNWGKEKWKNREWFISQDGREKRERERQQTQDEAQRQAKLLEEARQKAHEERLNQPRSDGKLLVKEVELREKLHKELLEKTPRKN